MPPLAESRHSDDREAILRVNVERAIEEFRASSALCRRLRAISHDVGATTPDGMTALGQAIDRYADALSRLKIAMREFNEYLEKLRPRLPHD